MAVGCCSGMLVLPFCRVSDSFSAEMTSRVEMVRQLWVVVVVGLGFVFAVVVSGLDFVDELVHGGLESGTVCIVGVGTSSVCEFGILVHNLVYPVADKLC